MEKILPFILVLVIGMFILFAVGIMLLSIIPAITFAHPGNTASDGCHYCRTNCSSWGETYGARHCHGSSNFNYSNSSTANKEGFPWKWLIFPIAIGGIIWLGRD